MHFEIYVAVAGFIVGMAVGATGMGGGALMTPVLVLLFKVQPLAAVSSDLVASLIMKPFGAAIHIGSHTVRWPLVRWLALGSVPAAFLGVIFLRSLGKGHAVQNVVSIALGGAVLLAVVAVVVKAILDRRGGVAPFTRPEPLCVRPLPTLALGAVTGFIVGITSVGSGTLVVIALLFLYPRLRGSQLVGTDLTQAIPMVAAAALAHILYGDFQLSLTLSIIAGSIPGVVLGSVLSSRAPTAVVRVVLCVVLLVSGLKLVNVPTADVGIALAVALTGAGAVLAYVARTRPQAWRREVPEPRVESEAVAA